MLNDSGDRAKFWDERLLDWEASRYEGRAGWVSRPTRLRQRLGVELLASFLRGRAVVEAGCGSGLLARRFIAAGAKSYLGVDHAPTVLAAAQARHGGAGIRFEVASAHELPAGGDVVVSLGLLDWLSDEELRVFFARHGTADFLHTFSERSGGSRQTAQRCWRAAVRLLRPRDVQPRFMSLDELRALLPPSYPKALMVYRDCGLRDAVFISSLPVAGGALA